MFTSQYDRTFSLLIKKRNICKWFLFETQISYCDGYVSYFCLKTLGEDPTLLVSIGEIKHSWVCGSKDSSLV